MVGRMWSVSKKWLFFKKGESKSVFLISIFGDWELISGETKVEYTRNGVLKSCNKTKRHRVPIRYWLRTECKNDREVWNNYFNMVCL